MCGREAVGWDAFGVDFTILMNWFLAFAFDGLVFLSFGCPAGRSWLAILAF